jgi:two-component system OmpR family sensor kinase
MGSGAPAAPAAPSGGNERDDVFALVAHELRNPLHALTLQLALARATAQSRGEGFALEHILKAQSLLSRYSERVTVLLDLVTLQPGAYTVKSKKVDLGVLLHDLNDSLAHDATYRDVRVVLDLAPDVALTTDPVLLEQVIDNLMLNAFKHASCTVVTLSLHVEGGHAVITVRDDGRGIAAEDQERIFGKFGVATNSQRGSGTGLGLWIVRKLLDALGGQLALTSAPGEGSAFSVRLPMTDRSEGPT